MAEPVRRSKRGVVHEDHGHDEELSIKIPRLDDLKEEDDKKSHVSVSPAVGVAASSRRDSRLSQGMEKPAELFRKDLISAMKLPDTDQLQQDDYVLISDHWKQEWEHGVQVPVNPRETIKRTISIRKVAGNENLHGSYAFKMPKKFLHATSDDSFKQGVHELHETQKLADQMCRYDLDDLDVVWLSKMNDEREAMGLDPVAEWVMEKVVDEMEAQCYSNMQNMIKTVEGLGIEYDENVTCDVCRSPEGEDNNEIVFCDGCDICVHQACYGIQKIPEGSWLCRTCALGIKPKCILCPKTGGAMKSTKSGTKWSHVSCALWIPEVSIGCPEKMEPITKISQIPSSRWSLICNICREREGACIQCSLKTCKTAFHVTCAFNNNLHMKTMLDEDHDDVQLKAYCAKHSGKQRRDAGGTETTPVSTPRKDAGTPKRDRILLQDPLTPGKRESEMTEEERTKLRSHRLGKLAEEFYMCVEVSEVAEACKMDEDTIDFFYNYWVLKRKSNFNKPLLTPKTEEADLLLRQREDSLVARMKMFIHLRQDLERVRNLCYMVSRREKIRRSLYSTKEEIFYQQVALINSLGKQSNTRDYNLIVRAHREPQTVYDKYAAIIHTAKLLESRYRLEEENATESESDNAGSVISSVASSTTAGKSKAKRVRDSKRRLAFAKSKAKKQMNTAVAATQESGDVKPLVEAGVDILRDSGQDLGAGDAPTTTPEKAEVLEPTTSTGKSRRGRKPLSFWQKKRSRRSIVRMAASSKPPDESHQPVMDTSVSEAEVSMSEETPADSQVVGDSPKESSSVGDSPKGRSRRSLRSRDSLAVPVQVAETSSCDDKVEPAKVEERTKEKTSMATSVETDVVVAAAEDKSDHEGASEVPKEEPKLENREDSEPVPSDSNEAESADQSVHEPRTTRTSRRTKNVSEPVEPSNSSKVSPSKRTRKSEALTEDTKSEAPVVEEKSSENCDSEKLDKDSESTSDLESVDTGSNYSPKVTRRRSALERSISGDSAPKLGGNGTTLPQVEVSVDETSGKISLRMRKPGLTEIPAEKQNGTPEIVENNKALQHRHSMGSVDLDAVSVDGSSSPKKDRLRVQRRSSSRLQSLGINGLVSPSQLVVRQEIKDKVHSRLGIHRVTRQHNGLTPSQVDTLLTASRRIKSPSKVDVTREILEGSLTKENHPGNCPLLSKYPISIDLAEKPGKLSNSRRSSVFSDKQETTPAMSTRSSRATTPEMYSSRRAHGNVIDISDSEDSLNLLAASDSEYAPSEDSEASGAGTRRHTRRSVALATDDDASRDSDARLTPRGGATTAKIASS